VGRSSLFTLAAALAAGWAAPGCASEPVAGDDTAQAEDPTTFACEIGLADEDGGWVAAADGDPAELVLGFQGFLFIELRARAEDTCPSPITVLMNGEVEGDTPFDGSQPDVGMTDQGDGTRLSDEIVMFLPTNDVGHFEGATLRTVMRLEGSELNCTTERLFTLVDDDPCIHTGGEPICPEGDTAGEM